MVWNNSSHLRASDSEITVASKDKNNELNIIKIEIVLQSPGHHLLPEELTAFIEKNKDSISALNKTDKGIAISGLIPIWAYLIISSYLHEAEFIACFYPNTNVFNGYIVCYVKEGCKSLAVGDLIAEKGEEKDSLDFKGSCKFESEDIFSPFGYVRYIKGHNIANNGDSYITPKTLIEAIENHKDIFENIPSRWGVILDFNSSTFSFMILDYYCRKSGWLAVRHIKARGNEFDKKFKVVRSIRYQPNTGLSFDTDFRMKKNWALPLKADPAQNPVQNTIAIIGPPQSGKSVFTYALYKAFLCKEMGCYLLRACPDGEGMWSQECTPQHFKEFRNRNKTNFSDKFMKITIDQIKNLKSQDDINFILLDCGGKISKENEIILGQCTQAVFIYREDTCTNAVEEWIDFLQTHCKVTISAVFKTELCDDDTKKSYAAFDEDNNRLIGKLYNPTRHCKIDGYIGAVAKETCSFLLKRQNI